jgi:hypothetical protein
MIDGNVWGRAFPDRVVLYIPRFVSGIELGVVINIAAHEILHVMLWYLFPNGQNTLTHIAANLRANNAEERYDFTGTAHTYPWYMGIKEFRWVCYDLDKLGDESGRLLNESWKYSKSPHWF